MIFQIICGELEDTLLLGEKLGKSCRGGEVFELISDLGGGKTAFVRGLARGIGTIDEVSSPSFTINNSYRSASLTLEHFDFYRLETAGIVGDQIHEDIFQKDTVVAVEWGDIVSDILPKDRVIVKIELSAGESRIFTILYSKNLAYLLELDLRRTSKESGSSREDDVHPLSESGDAIASSKEETGVDRLSGGSGVSGILRKSSKGIK